MKRYRIEVFDRNLSFRLFSEIEEPDIYLDALVQTESTVVCPGKAECSRGDYIQVKIDGKVYYQGIVADSQFDGSKTEITIQQMSALFNTEVFADVTLLSSQTIEQWLSNLITATFAGSDTYQNLQGLNVEVQSATSGSHAASNSGAYNLYDLITSFFKVYGVITQISFDPAADTVNVVLKAVDEADVWKLNLGVSDVSSYDIQKSIDADAPNKMIIKNEANPAQSLTYYWHPTDFSGSVDTDGTVNRVVPVITACEEVQVDEGDTFANASYQAAVNKMYATRYDDLITVVFKAESKLMPVGSIGQLYTLIEGENEYNTMLTGIHAVNMAYVELTFGYVRKRLTQILKLRRQS